MKAAYHMVHYRRFDDAETRTGSTLEELLRRALGAAAPGGVPLWHRPEDRIFSLGDSDARQVVLNKVADQQTAVVGEMCLAQERDLQPLLEHKARAVQLSRLTKATVFDLDERGAPNGTQFIRGMAYWLAIGNHLFFLKTYSMTPALIEDYLDWLLRRQTSTISGAAAINLQAEFDRSVVGGDLGEIRGLKLSGGSQMRVVPAVQAGPDGEQPAKTRATVRKVADRFLQSSAAEKVVEAIFGHAKTEQLKSALGEGEYLSVNTSIKVRGRRTDHGRNAFRDVIKTVDGLADTKVEVEGKYGKSVNGEAILRTRMPFELPDEGGNLLLFDNVADQLHEVYSRFVKDGKISA